MARRYDISRGLLWNWRQQVRRGTLTATAEPHFLALGMLPEPGLPLALDRAETRSHSKRPAASNAMIEIVLPDGVTIRVTSDVEADALHRVLGVLRG